MDIIERGTELLWEHVLDIRRKQFMLEGILVQQQAQTQPSVALTEVKNQTQQGQDQTAKGSELKGLKAETTIDSSIALIEGKTQSSSSETNKIDSNASMTSSDAVQTNSSQQGQDQSVESLSSSDISLPIRKRRIESMTTSIKPQIMTIQEQNALRIAEAHLFVSPIIPSPSKVNNPSQSISISSNTSPSVTTSHGKHSLSSKALRASQQQQQHLLASINNASISNNTTNILHGSLYHSHYTIPETFPLKNDLSKVINSSFDWNKDILFKDLSIYQNVPKDADKDKKESHRDVTPLIDAINQASKPGEAHRLYSRVEESPLFAITQYKIQKQRTIMTSEIRKRKLIHRKAWYALSDQYYTIQNKWLQTLDEDPFAMTSSSTVITPGEII